ncbi:MAG TPA: hypothetical protein VGR00_06205 [Thermoanaerobaculia bacterium]|nr:hypothetical protein [Thermoanaerobaculia bacterium]
MISRACAGEAAKGFLAGIGPNVHPVCVTVVAAGGVTFGVPTHIGVAVDVGVAVGVDVGVAVGVDVGVKVGVDVGVKVGVNVTVAVGVRVGVRVGVKVGVRVGVAVDVGVDVENWASARWTRFDPREAITPSAQTNRDPVRTRNTPREETLFVVDSFRTWVPSSLGSAMVYCNPRAPPTP